MWIVAWAVPYNSSIEEYDSYEEAKKVYDNYKENIGSRETLYLAEVKLFKEQH